MVKLTTQFGFNELLQKIRESDSGGESAADQLNATVDRLIANAAENTEAKLNEFINTVLDKVSRMKCSAIQIHTLACEMDRINVLKSNCYS